MRFSRNASVVAVALSAAFGLLVAGPSGASSGSRDATTTTAPVSTTTVPRSTTTTLAVARGPVLRLGSRGTAVRVVQTRLAALHYWIGGVTGVFGDSTQQAVYALQKAAGLRRDGIVGTATRHALVRGVTATPRRASGRLVEIDLRRNLLMFVRDSRLVAVLNTSTGGGYSYSEGGMSGVAVTPRGNYHVLRQVNGMDVSPLGELWRPKYFNGGYAVHGSWSVPPVPVSHGCVRLSIEAMNWVWAANLMPLGTRVWVF
jgi:lipoprotein-anchoring transpeptidase ErfK/SrfK